MICKWCNKEIDDSAKFCPNCGGNIQNIDNSINNNEVIEQSVMNNIQDVSNSIDNTQVVQKPIVNTVQPQPTPSPVVEQKANVWLVILSVLIPIAGLIIFLVKKDDDKKTAKASGIAALISFGFSILITIISVVLLFSAAGKFVGDVIDDAIDSANDYEDNYNDYYDDDDIYDDDLQNVNTSTEWKNYEVLIDGTTLKLPCTYNELSLATEAKMKSSYEKSYLAPNYYASVNLYKDDKLVLYTDILNDTDSDAMYIDSKVTRVWQSKYQISQDAEIIVFPGNLKAGQEITKEEIINLFGEPSKIDNYSSGDYNTDTYSYYENPEYTTFNYYQIKVLNGVIEEIILDHRSYN